MNEDNRHCQSCRVGNSVVILKMTMTAVLQIEEDVCDDDDDL